ncbi:MAG: murein biosynthesis integral membrane protein MurJ [Hyphomicrobiales bacterium]|nr:murein biosynthesis integral membrane protein MurJ [Hyphomicrobiales bacterium]
MGLFGKFFTVGGATLASRFLGFAREMLIASILGAGPVADAFYAAFRFPNLFRRLFAEGAFNSAFVPMFSSELESNDRYQAKQFAETVLSYLVVVLIVLTAVAEIAMPWLVGTIIAPKFIANADKFDLTVELTRIMFPYLFCMSIVAMLSGILNSLRHYFVAAIVPVILNIILVGVLLAAHYLNLETFAVGRVLAWGVLTAGFVQMGLLYFAARQRGFALSMRLPRPSKRVKKLLALALPLALTGGITQINLLVGQIIASAQDGAIAMLNYADRIYQLPLGVVGIAIGVVLLPELTRALASSNESEVQKLQSKSLEFALMLTLPAAVGLYFLPVPIVAILYERGAFDAETTLLTASALAAFAVGLPSFVLQKVFQPTYFARFNMRAPMWFAAGSAITNIVGSLLLFPQYGHVGIAISTSIAGWVNAILLISGLLLGTDYRLRRGTIAIVIKIILASVFMGLALYFSTNFTAGLMDNNGPFVGLLILLAVIAGSAAFYFGLLIGSGALNTSELRSILSRWR